MTSVISTASGINSTSNISNIGNEVAVKVAVRLRPLSNREKLHQHQPCVRISSETNQIVIGKDKSFTFDYVIPPKTTQAELYDNCVKNLVNSIFEGYNATVFAYGQTGSGKTFTISGNKTNVEEFGIIPRAVHTMFQIINNNSATLSNSSSSSASRSPTSRTQHQHQSSNNQHQSPKEYCVKVNFIEIYKEELKDLLDSSEKDLQIREDETGNTLIYGANEVICHSLEEVMACFDAGSALRHTGSTLMNEQSSRSHSVFTVSIEQRWSDNTAKTTRDSSSMYDLSNPQNLVNSYYLGAKFHFVDLAGSERVHRTGNVGDRFKESIHINSGLLALGNVISALSSNDSKKKTVHIPYRESKITRILKDSLGGNANTLMICCVSPSSCNLDESINAVKYASRARYIKNKPIINMDPQTQKFVEMQGEIQALREELLRQRTALMSATELNHNAITANTSNHSKNSSDHELETRLETAQLECDHYKKLVKEAYNRFKQLNKSTSDFATSRKLVDEWLIMFEACKNRDDFDIEDYAKQKINQLEAQLKQAQDDLKSDEEIFSDREKEISALKDTVNDLEAKLSLANRYLEAACQKEKEQQELMIQFQIQLDKTMQNNKKQAELNSATQTLFKEESEIISKGIQSGQSKSNSNKNSILNNSLSVNSNKLRAKTAPNENTNNEAQLNEKEKNKHRSVFSSPAMFHLERVMQNFRARSQLLADTLEDNDCVMQKFLSSTFDIETGELDENLIDGEGNEVENDENKPFVRKGTFKVEKQKTNTKNEMSNVSVIDKRSNKNENLDQHKKLRDLSINIKMKEELIKELVANSKFTNRINLQYQQRIELLQKEKTQLNDEINDLKSQLLHLRQVSPTGSGKETTRVELDLKKRLEQSQAKIAELESKQNMSVKLLNTNQNTDKKVAELELALSKLKQQNDSLTKKIKDDTEKKLKLEKDFEKEQQKLKDLEMRTDQQQRILKKKSEDLVTAQRRLRSGSATSGGGTGANSDAENNNNNKHWIEQEMEKIINEKRQMELVREELQKREELVKKKELLMREKNDLELKKLRSSQMVRESLAVVDQNIESLNKQMVNNKTHVKELLETQSNLVKQRRVLEERLAQGGILSSMEERRLIEIEEAIEALECAIDYEKDSISGIQSKMLSNTTLNEISENVLKKLNTIPHEETQNLVSKFFQKIITLKEVEHKKQLENSELQVQLDEQTQMVEQLKQTLNTSTSESEKQKIKFEKANKLLTQQLNECTKKIDQLEKEIVLYQEKLGKLKKTTQFDSDSTTSITNGSGGFYLKNNGQSNDLSQVESMEKNDKVGTSIKAIKVSRKDLRRLTEEDLLKRSLKTSTISNNFIENDLEEK